MHIELTPGQFTELRDRITAPLMDAVKPELERRAELCRMQRTMYSPEDASADKLLAQALLLTVRGPDDELCNLDAILAELGRRIDQGRETNRKVSQRASIKSEKET